MGTKSKFIVFALITIDIILIGYLLLHGKTIAVLNPAGIIALQERNLLFFAVALGLSVIIPTLVLTFFIAWKYRADNPKAQKYRPEWDHSVKFEIFRWGLMSAIIAILAVVTWKVAYTLDPYKPLQSSTKPITIQVVALQWRWLFIYPEQHIATINYIAFPEKTPVNFQLTADAPMNSFWIPQLGGQIYAMSGMSTKTHMMADRLGEFQGSDAEISGEGFADMKFVAQSMTQKDFDTWVQTVQQSPKQLTLQQYNILSKPSKSTSNAYYTLSDEDLYNQIMMKFMQPNSMGSEQTPSTTPKQMNMTPNEMRMMPNMHM